MANAVTAAIPGRVSVVTPCYNGERFLGAAIESALAQTYGDVEVIVADDGSTDGSADVAASYGDRVRVLRQGNAGPSAARNRALGAATGEFVALLDADDRFHPTKLAHQAAVLRQRPDVGAVYCGWRFVDASGRELPERGWPRLAGDLFGHLLLGNLFHPVTVMIRRSLVDQAGGFREVLPVNEDWDLFLRLGRRGLAWACVDEALCDYRIHAGQSHERLALVHGHALRILERAFEDPDLPSAIQTLRARAFEAAHLRAAAEYYAAGLTADGDAAFDRAVSLRPALLADTRTWLAFLRQLLPDGYRSRDEVVRRRGELIPIVRRAARRHGRRAQATFAWARLRLAVRKWGLTRI